MTQKKSATHKRALRKAPTPQKRKVRWGKVFGIASIIAFIVFLLMIMATLVLKYYHLVKYHP